MNLFVYSEPVSILNFPVYCEPVCADDDSDSDQDDQDQEKRNSVSCHELIAVAEDSFILLIFVRQSTFFPM